MIELCALLVATASFLQPEAQAAVPQTECGDFWKIGRRTSLSINSKMAGDGEWETHFSATRNSSGPSRNITVDLTHAVFECHGNQIVNIQGVVKGSSLQGYMRTHRFYSKGSSNAVIAKDGLVLQKAKLNEHAAAITSRPLDDDEVFEVRVDKRDDKSTYGIGIGVSKFSPAESNLSNHIYHNGSGTWIFYNTHLYEGKTVTNQDYIKTILHALEVNARFGVSRKSDGSLHLYIDGVDQGAAASGIPHAVYGLFELYPDALRGTIVDP